MEKEYLHVFENAGIIQVSNVQATKHYEEVTCMFILLACGSGASSGFMAEKMRCAAEEMHMQARIEAVSESELEDYLEDADCILLGPHLAYVQPVYEEMASEFQVPVQCISQDIYGSLDGKRAVEEAIKCIQGKEK